MGMELSEETLAKNASCFPFYDSLKEVEISVKQKSDLFFGEMLSKYGKRK